MVTLDDIVNLLARAGVPYKAFDADHQVCITPEYIQWFDAELEKSGLTHYEYSRILALMLTQLYEAFENTLDAFDEYRYSDEEYWLPDLNAAAGMGGELQ